MDVLDPVGLTTLRAAVREGTFERAAKSLNITPSAVSQRMRALERAVGAVLVSRSKPVQPTPDGEVLLALALQWSLLRDEAVSQLTASQSLSADEHPRVRLSVPIATGADALALVLLPAMAQVEREVPVSFEIFREDDSFSVDLLRQGRVVGALSSDPTPVHGHTAVPLGTIRYLPLATPEYVQRHLPDGPTPEALAVAPLIAYDRKDLLQYAYLTRLLEDDLRPPTTYVPANREFEEAVLLGLGWALVPEGRMHEQLEAGDLVRIAPGYRDVPLVWHRPRIESAVLDLLGERLAAVAREVVRGAEVWENDGLT
ncbi:ArgP/LysG family DNA-binding transcriptional regulator [Kytococcus sp. Marseille-QA3725]